MPFFPPLKKGEKVGFQRPLLEGGGACRAQSGVSVCVGVRRPGPGLMRPLPKVGVDAISFTLGMPSSSAQLTRILKSWSSGDESALEQLTPLVYAELRRIAAFNMSNERVGHLLQPSALVNEAFVRLLGRENVEWVSRAHFYAHSARLMRQILIDFARAQETEKRGGRPSYVDISSISDLPGDQGRPVAFLDLDSALKELAELDQRQAKIVELRYFGGLEIPEITAVLGVSDRTVRRDWQFARAWLYSRLKPESLSAGAVGSP